MSKADEMFEDIKFDKIKDNKKRIEYQHRINPFKTIVFDVDKKFIYFNSVEVIGIKRLQAINEKVKELGWND